MTMQEEKELSSLIRALGAELPGKRESAAVALGKIGDVRAVEPLTAALSNEFFPYVREAIVEALERIGLPTDADTQTWCAAVKKDWTRITSLGVVAMELLIGTLNDHDIAQWKREAAAKVLGQIRDARAVEPLIAAIRDIRVVSEAFYSSDENMAGYVEYREVDKNREVREAAAKALGNIGDARAIEPLIVALDDKYMYGSDIAEALGKIGDARAVEPLIKALKRDDRPGLQQSAAEALGKIGDARAVEPLIAAFVYAIRVVHRWGPGKGFNYEDDSTFRRVVITSVVRFGVSAVSPLIAALASRRAQDYARVMVVEALVEIGDARAVKPLIETLKKDTCASVRVAAIKALGQLGAALAVEPFIISLKDKDSGVRKAAAVVLGRIGDARAVKPLIFALQDQNDFVAKAAANALGQIGDDRAVKPLNDLLNHPPVRFRFAFTLKEAATEALRMIDYARASKPATSIPKKGSPGLREAATIMLKQIKRALHIEDP